jgi:uncharacterized Zn finger protein (UPF0148 family)
VQAIPADISGMASTNCAACGADLADSGARFCSSCGVPVATVSTVSEATSAPATAETALETAEFAPETAKTGSSTAPPEPTTVAAAVPEATMAPADRPLRRSLTEEQWRYTTWGAVAAGAVAIVALVAVVFGLLSRAEDASAASSERGVATTTTTTTIPIADGPTAAARLTEPVTIEAPRLGAPVWYRLGPTAVIYTLTMNECDRIDGMLRASGEIRNNSPLGQTLDFRFGVEMTRPTVGTTLATLEGVIGGLEAGEAVEWITETPSTKTASLRCDIPLLTVSPAVEG